MLVNIFAGCLLIVLLGCGAFLGSLVIASVREKEYLVSIFLFALFIVYNLGWYLFLSGTI